MSILSPRQEDSGPSLGDGALVEQRNCWAIARATRASVIIDAEDYFEHARAAMLAAKHRIMLVGWDFDARINLVDGGNDEAPTHIGELITWLSKTRPELEIFLLRWDVGAVKAVLRGTTIFTLAHWMSQPNIHTKLDSVHPPGGSHHQKIVVIDDCFAFCGGIDMTGDRWDTRAHNDHEPRRIRPGGGAYPPWHDATSALQGPVAAKLGELCRDRWMRAGGHPITAIESVTDCWPASLPVQFSNIDIAISRSQPKSDDEAAVIEIEQLYLDQIARARRSIYAESQYFASRKIAEAIARRLDEPDGPEIIVINPQSANGWLEPLAMDTARARLYEALRARDVHQRFRMYHPYTTGGAPIYVHAKLLIVDDQILRVGSSNFNNRSLRLDSECDITIDAARQADADVPIAITAIRDGLIAEHLGCEPRDVTDAIAEHHSIIATIEALRGNGRLRPYRTPNLNDVEKWIADNEVLDPEGPDDMFEPLGNRGLLRRLKSRVHWRRD